MRLHEEWALTPHRFALHRSTRMAVVADLHLGYVSARRQDGEAVPHFGEQERLEQLSRALVLSQVKALVIAGDAVESARAGADLLAAWVLALHRQGIAVHLTPGNHDRGLCSIPHLHVHEEGFVLGTWRIVHDAAVEAEQPLVHGHLHPCVRSGLAPGEAVCFLHHERRLVLPAWCDHASGVNVLGMRAWKDVECSAIVGERVIGLGGLSALRKKLSRPPRPYRIGFGLTT
jgi:metallophosphoesterase superfamily enzyme